MPLYTGFQEHEKKDLGKLHVPLLVQKKKFYEELVTLLVKNSLRIQMVCASLVNSHGSHERFGDN